MKTSEYELRAFEEQEYTISDLLAIVRRRQVIIYGAVAAFCIVAAVYCALSTRRYEVVGVVQFQKDSADAMGLESMLSGGADSASDTLGANIDLQTQVNILQSDTLALKTIETLHLEKSADFKWHWASKEGLFDLISASGPPDPQEAKLEESPRLRRRVINVFEKNLDVKPLTGTRLIEIHYRSSDPKLAAAVVNTLMRALADYTFQTRYTATNQTSQWLNEQLNDLRKNSEDLQAKVVDLERQSGVYSLDSGDPTGANKQIYSGVIDRLQQTTVALSAAEQNRILKAAILHAATTGSADMLSGLAGNMMGSNSQSMNNSLSLIQSLRQQEASAQAALDQAQEKFGPAYSRIAELRGQLTSVQHAVQEEIKRVRARAESDYQVAVQTENETRRQYNEAKVAADKLNDKAIGYAIARQDAIESRTLYADLLKRLKQAGVLEGLRSSNITVVDPGRVPDRPVKPDIPLYMAVAFVSGLVVGCCLVFLVDSLNNKVNNTTDLEGVTGNELLGSLPLVPEMQGAQKSLVMLDTPSSPYAEAVRAIRTAILLSRSDQPPKSVLVASSIAGEGKSTFSLNLALALAQQGSRVLLIDADLRRGSISKSFGYSSSATGLSTLLSGISSNGAEHSFRGGENVFFVPTGPIPPNPSELLGSKSFRTQMKKWQEQYDFIVCDGAPVLPVTDSVALNDAVDLTLLLARAEMVEKAQVQRSLKLLAKEGKHIVGLVLNGLNGRDSSYYAYYGYHGNDVYPYKEDQTCVK